MDSFRGKGEVYKWTNGTGSAVSSGDVVAIGGIVGIAIADIANGADGSVRIAGVVNVTTDGTYALVDGQRMYYDSANTRFTAVRTAQFAGVAADAKAASGTTVRMILNVGAPAGTENAITDPGDAGAIPVTESGHVDIVSAGAETRTLAAPSAEGQRLLLVFKTDGGDVVLTAATGLTDAGRTTYRFQNAGECLELVAVDDGANIRWRIVGGDDGLANVITDPGDAGAIPVERSGSVDLVSAAAETRTLAAPSFEGQQLSIVFKTDAGDVVLTAATGLTDAGRTTYRFQNAGECLELVAVDDGANIRWRIVGGDDGLANVIPDPGSTNAIPVERSGSCAITTAAAETNTLAAPSFVGQMLTLSCDVYAVGDRVVTCATTVNETGNNTLTFGVAGDSITLIAIDKAGALRWHVLCNDGVALSTV